MHSYVHCLKLTDYIKDFFEIIICWLIQMIFYFSKFLSEKLEFALKLINYIRDSLEIVFY